MIAFTEGLQSEVITILHACIELFDFDKDRDTIKHLAILYQNCLDPNLQFPCNGQERPRFVAVYKEIMGLIEQARDFSYLHPQQKEALMN
mmetsp:Transcript_19156/g.16439  ORF Transcript_19156/g.16439 Transcript_19156/m.16439 type:complete len:90 (+) Transcript_19156:95-364(+)